MTDPSINSENFHQNQLISSAMENARVERHILRERHPHAGRQVVSHEYSRWKYSPEQELEGFIKSESLCTYNENGMRAYKGQTPLDNIRGSAALYGRYAEIASEHPASWNFGKQLETAETIGTITQRNRMICFPCRCELYIL
jgi:hypothetical protein